MLAGRFAEQNVAKHYTPLTSKMNLSLLMVMFVIVARSSASIDVDSVSGINTYLYNVPVLYSFLCHADGTGHLITGYDTTRKCRKTFYFIFF